jgi:hypothetical protein
MLFDAVTGQEMRAARLVTGATMVALIGVSVVPGLRPHATAIRLVLLAVYLLVCAAFVTAILLR